MAYHDHTPACKHENVKYCAKCDVVACKDCPKVWQPSLGHWWEYTPTQYPVTWTYTANCSHT